jgi:hypothetical protein
MQWVGPTVDSLDVPQTLVDFVSRSLQLTLLRVAHH